MRPANRPLKLEDVQRPEIPAGENPFAESNGESTAQSASDSHAAADYRGAYETSQKSFGRRYLGLTVFAAGLLGTPVALLFFPWAGFLVLPIYILVGVACWLTSLVLTGPIFVLAHWELKAIRLGALTDRHRRENQVAMGLALVVFLAAIALPCWLLFNWIWQAFLP